MRRILLDTHILLWWLSGSLKLSQSARHLIEDPKTCVYISAAVAWELAIKKSIGCVEFPGNLASVLDKEHISILDITLNHALAAADLPLLHQDPFDRIQIAQAQIEGLELVTRDDKIQAYDVAWVEG